MPDENRIRPSLWLSSFAEHLQFKYEIEGPFRGHIDGAFLDEVRPPPEVFLRNAHTADGVGLRQLKDFLVHLCQLKTPSGSSLFTLDGAAYLTDALMRVRVHCCLAPGELGVPGRYPLVERQGSYARAAAGRTENPPQTPSASNLQRVEKARAASSAPTARPGPRPSASAPSEGPTTHAHRSVPPQARTTPTKPVNPAADSSQTCTSQPGRNQADAVDRHRTERTADKEQRYTKPKHMPQEHAQLSSGGSAASEGCNTRDRPPRVSVHKLTFPVNASTPSVHGKRQRSGSLQRGSMDRATGAKALKQEPRDKDDSAAPSHPNTPDILPATTSRGRAAA